MLSSQPTATLPAALLFDLDGTLIDSRAAVDRVWRRWARRHGLDPASVLPFVYGHRSGETVSHFAPHLDPINEANLIDREQANDVQGVRALPSAADVLHNLEPDRWAIVTSATRELALARLRAAGLPTPVVMICADEVAAGKPAPDGYLTAATRLSVAAADCVVVEDTPSGVEAALAAGMAVVAITTTHSVAELESATRTVEALADLLPTLEQLLSPTAPPRCAPTVSAKHSSI